MCADITLTRHSNFWRGFRLFVERDLCFKISKFPISDPEVVRLSSAGGLARDILYRLMLDHINSGKRTKRLTPVDGMAPRLTEPAEDSDIVAN